MAEKKNTQATAEKNSAAAPAQKEALKNNELVAEAAIDVLIDVPEVDDTPEAPKEETKETEAPKEETKETEAPKTAKEDVVATADVIVINTSLNPICLSDGKRISVQIAPKEFKRIDRETYRELMQQNMVRIWFDKGILTSNGDAGETEVHGAEAPEELSQPVISRDGGNSVSAEVTKFEKAKSIKIDL